MICFLLLVAVNLLMAAHAWAALPGVRIEIKLTTAMRQYCHIVRFPQGWGMQRFDDQGAPLSFFYRSEYEFRAEGILSTQFLVVGFKDVMKIS